MIRRPLWLGTGIVIGVAGTLWTEQRVRRLLQETQERLSPDHVVRTVTRGAQELPARLRAAANAATAAASEERDLRRDEIEGRLGSAGAGDAAGVVSGAGLTGPPTSRSRRRRPAHARPLGTARR